ncbi:gluconokinase [Mycobacteroides salmoniphilum]|uniref:gluconokinase n=1 Tax=Mycobacteroides salmoniphilum TaxID=404941 RepID=UPI001AD84D71|nr:gluconokinase [Mycobacteroides salmoniphilum]
MSELTAVPILVVMGVSGTGKSTIAGLLAGKLGWQLIEGDDLHPGANIAKMAAGRPLTDADRWPWLHRIAQRIKEIDAAGRPGIVTCSALTRAHRDRIRIDNVVFIHLQGPIEIIERRLGTRLDHFMPAALLRSQFDALEPPGDDERRLTIDIGPEPAMLAERIIEALGLTTPGPAR